jgi:FkbM family methyltransferase
MTEDWMYAQVGKNYIESNHFQGDEIRKPIKPDTLGEQTVSHSRLEIRNGCDVDFYGLVDKLKNTGIEVLLTNAAKGASVWHTEDRDYYESLCKWYNDWYRVGAMSISDQGFVQYFGSKFNYLQTNIEDLVNFYRKLANYRSKYQLKTILQFWMTFSPKIGEHGVDFTFGHYYDLDLIKCDENEVFVDCGAFDGDSILTFIKQYGGKYKSIYGYELTHATYKKALENTKGHERIYIRNAGVADKNGTMTFQDMLIPGGNRLMDGGNAVGNIVKMDDDIHEDITFIKMDIEGAEIAALLGAAEHIKRTKPKLAISLYHKLSDLINIPKLIHLLVPEYKLYFQHCPPPGFPFPTEYVLLAVCENQINEKHKE